MPTNSPSQNQACQRRRRLILLVAAACLTSFAVGYWTSLRRHEDRVRAEAWRQVLNFVGDADQLGIIDHRRLDELNADNTNGEADMDADGSN